MTSELADKPCIPCRGGVPPLKGERRNERQRRLDDGWRVTDQHHLERHFKFKNFSQALDFTNRVGELAEFNPTGLRSRR